MIPWPHLSPQTKRALVRVLLCYGALEIVTVIIIIIIIIIIIKRHLHRFGCFFHR